MLGRRIPSAHDFSDALALALCGQLGQGHDWQERPQCGAVTADRHEQERALTGTSVHGQGPFGVLTKRCRKDKL